MSLFVRLFDSNRQWIGKRIKDWVFRAKGRKLDPCLYIDIAPFSLCFFVFMFLELYLDLC